MSIPKKLHITWKNKNVLDSNFDMINYGLKNFKILNPNWSIEISDDEDLEYYLKNNLVHKDYNLIKNIGVVAKSDIWRLLKIYHEGGMYFDIDRYCNKNLDDLITNDVKWVLPICNYFDFSQDFMCSEPNNPAFSCAIHFYFNRRYAGFDDIYFLGAQTYMHAVTYTLLNEIVNSNPQKEVFEKIIEFIGEHKFIKTYVETIPNDTVLYKGEYDYETWTKHKIDFYKQYNVKHWTNAW